jgi:trehalose 6-phosphate phosphatase
VDSSTLIALLAEDPTATAVLLDVDGVLAPIVARPEDARVPNETRAELRRLAERYALVACVSGRTGADARGIVGLDGLEYVGVHGLELEPEAEEWRERLHDFTRTVDWPPDEVEDKGLTVSFHYRLLPEAAADLAAEIAERARAAGLLPLLGRKVLELRPPVEANKGTAVRRLLAERGLRRALYAGDDTTDLDAFAALDGLGLAVRVAVASAEAPPGLREAADVVVDSPAALRELLRLL